MDTLFDNSSDMRSVRSGGKGPQNGPNEDPNDGPKSPLAARLRPSQIAGFVGQQQLLAPGSALATALELGRPHSMILYGPPGSGKTTLARILAQRAASAYEELSAVAAGRPEIRAVLERAQHRRATSGQATVLFLDEIHRFNKVQQDALLPAVEDGLLTLIGATTENPAFEVIGALLSRVRVYALEALAPADIETILRRGAEELGADAAPEAIEFLASHSEGDA
ncbi:MAG TPA: AAA family ATPase, partial [Solirubrobacteraceae bacterium]|nr:AAA family ATPase [Solirubrobacteraceae bacterium]